VAEQVLVTGAGGFIGSHLVEALVARDYRVRAFVRYNSQNSWGWIDALPCKDAVEVYRGDIRDYDSVMESMDGVQAVFHLAALIGIPYSYRSPQAYIRTNVDGSYNVLQAARECGVRRIVQTSTSEVYGTAEYVPIDERHPLNPQSPYAATKVAADALALSFHRSFDLPVVVVRPFNTYGPRQSARAVIPTIITQALEGRTAVSLGDVNPTRDFNFVKDTVQGFVQVGMSDSAVGHVVNLATGREVSIRDIVGMVGRILGTELTVVGDEARLRPAKSEVERLCGENRKALNLAGWSPSWSLEEGLRETIEWFRMNRRFYRADLYNV
jgi:dTDP-glucose 4,6-dehydratase